MLFPLPVSLLTEMESNDGISNKAVQLRKVINNKICDNHIQHFIIFSLTFLTNKWNKNFNSVLKN